MADQVESAQGEAEAGTGQKRSFGVLQVVVVVVVVMLAEGVIVYTLLKKGPAQTPDQKVGKAGTMGQMGEPDLRAPSVEVKDVITSVRVDASGNKLKNMIVSLNLKLGRNQLNPESELDVADLENNYVPRVKDFVPEFRHMLLERISKRNYAQLQQMDAWREMLDKLKAESNKKLQQYGLEPRIKDIYVQTLSFD